MTEPKAYYALRDHEAVEFLGRYEDIHDAFQQADRGGPYFWVCSDEALVQLIRSGADARRQSGELNKDDNEDDGLGWASEERP